MLELWGSNPQEAVKLLLEVGDNKGAVSIWDSPFCLYKARVLRLVWSSFSNPSYQGHNR
jgi:hypothetical protein